MAKTRKIKAARKKTVPVVPLYLPLPKHKVLHKAFRIMWKYRWWHLAAVLLVSGGISYVYIFKDFPSLESLSTNSIAQTTKIYDRDGKLLYDIYIDKNRTVVPYPQIPLYVRQATIAIEDKEFYRHKGVNPIGGILRAAKETLFRKRLQGGSTITQQLVKTALLTPERTIPRKIKEIILAVLVELRYSKDQILEMYLNYVPYGGTAWGIEAAAETYFGKKVSELTLAESTLLAGLPAAPTLFSPYGAHPELAKGRQFDVLKRMVEDGYISQAEADTASNQDLKFKAPTTNIKAPHFVMYVKEKLVEKYGEKLVERGGLKVTTTLDLDIQEYAESTVSSEIAKLDNLRVTNGAAMVTRPATGEILAMVGSKDYFATDSGNFNVTTANRQPGSAIKPVNYAIGLENRIVTPGTVFNDIPTCFQSIPRLYCPKNYDGKFHGPVQLRFALGNSFNVPAVKMLKLNSVVTMVASSSAFGITTMKDPSKFGLSLTLGGGEVPMTEMITAFGIFANSGIRKDLTAIHKVIDAKGNILEENKDPNINKENPSSLLIQGPRVLSAETAFLISHILLDPNARSQSIGPNNQLQISGHPAVSVKTGTTDDLRDNWTIGFTPDYAVAAWVGNNDNAPMNPYLTSGVTGAAPIWNKITTQVLKDKKENWPKKPDSVVGLQICPLSGLLPQEDNSCGPRFEYFIKGTEPRERENLKQQIAIDKGTGRQATPNQTENIEVQEKTVVKDPFGYFCLDCVPMEGSSAQVIR